MPVKEITIQQTKGAFSLFKKPSKSKEYNFAGIAEVRQLLGNEKARILNVIKTENPSSLYELSKKLGRDFKSVHSDVKLLEKFKFIQLIEEKENNRKRHKPKLLTDAITIHIKL